jgi:hypothetical protein
VAFDDAAPIPDARIGHMGLEQQVGCDLSPRNALMVVAHDQRLIVGD